MQDFIIDKEIQELLPPLSKEEMESLEANILGANGIHVDRLVLLKINGEKNLILGDGHHRHEICQRHGIPFETRTKAFPSREAAIQWIIDNQLGRRNLTDERRAYYRGKEYLNTKMPVGKHGKGEETSPLGDTAESLGDKHGVSDTTIKSDATFAKAVDQLSGPEKESVLSGDSGESKKSITEGKKPVLCERCQRKGVIANCSMCKELREKKPTKKKGRGSKASSGPCVDAFKNEIPQHLRDAYADPWVQDSIDFIAVTEEAIRKKRLADGMDKRARHYPFFVKKEFVDGVGFVMNYLELLLDHLKDNRVAGVCPSCSGNKCPDCKMSGLVPRELYATLKKQK